MSCPTLARMSRWANMTLLNPNCLGCKKCGKELPETDLHLFFDCYDAFEIWKKVKTYIQKLMPGHRVQCFLFTMSIFPDEIVNSLRKLNITMIQITLR